MAGFQAHEIKLSRFEAVVRVRRVPYRPNNIVGILASFSTTTTN